MLGVSFQKMFHKKWMILSLLLGSILLIATVACFPLYQSAVYDRMLQEELEQDYTYSGKYPGRIIVSGDSLQKPESEVIEKMAKVPDALCKKLNIDVTEETTCLFQPLRSMNSLMKRDDANGLSASIGYLSDFENHIDMIKGEMFSEAGVNEDGVIEAVINTECMRNKGILMGETLELQGIQDDNGNPVRIMVKGVFKNSNKKDPYWDSLQKDVDSMVLLNKKQYQQLFGGEKAAKYKISFYYTILFDYTKLTIDDVKPLIKETQILLEQDKQNKRFQVPAYLNTLLDFNQKRTRIDATLIILQIPVLAFLCAFLIMISGQMYESERNEISVLKSRGSSGAQIFKIYLYQSTFIVLLGELIGVPLGGLFCQFLGSASNFLEFNIERTLKIQYSPRSLGIALLAGLFTIMLITLPAIWHSKVTIVNLKQQKTERKHSIWEICFLDVICLLVSLYGYYNFTKNRESIALSVLSEKPLDPLLYFSSSLFILGLGLLFIRLQPYLYKLIFKIGEKRWKPANYASFIENVKSGRKQQAIMIFMIMTIALGIYHATAARTICKNTEDNIAYLEASDVMMREYWQKKGNAPGVYWEPDYSKFESMDAAKSYTKVHYADNAYVMSEHAGFHTGLMGIHTKEFGENTSIDDSLLEEPYHKLLNALAAAPDGVLISRCLQQEAELNIGDSIQYAYNGRNVVLGKVVGVFDYWPGYAPTYTEVDGDNNVKISPNYFIIVNLSTLQKEIGVRPYDIYITLKDGKTSEDVVQWINDNQIRMNRYESKEEEIESVLSDPLLQGTNGILSLSFVVSIILCIIGYLIYWIMSIRSREMLFGVLRACGMHKGELFHMLLNEQFFSGVLSVAAGIVIGKITSIMFVPMLQTAYSASYLVLPMELVANEADMYQLYGIIFASMLICLGVLIGLVYKMDVAKALKLGEE